MKFDYCPHCKRDLYPGEPPFDDRKKDEDNHVARCIYRSKIPLTPASDKGGADA